MVAGQDDVSITLGFDVDEADLEKAFESQVQELSTGFDEASKSAADLVKDIQSLVSPMRDVRDMAKDMAKALKEAADSAKDIKSNMASTRLHAGAGATGTAARISGGSGGGGGGLGGIASMLGIAGSGAGIGGMVTGGLTALAGTALAGLGGLAATTLGYGAWNSALGGNETWGEGGHNAIVGRGGSRSQELRGILHGYERGPSMGQGGFFAPIQALGQGFSPMQVHQAASGRQLAGAYGMVRGIFGGLGQGPTGLFSQVVGGAYGSAGGFDVAEQLASEMNITGAGRTAMTTAGAESGRQMISGMTQRYIEEGQARLPGYLATMASLASPRTLGATRSGMRGLRPGRWGYGPGEFGGELAGLYSGFGGGELTDDTTQTAIAYSRAYGVSMGAQGQAIGGLANIGGGLSSAEQREGMMLRVMTDAVAAGFGRRLPEFAQAVGTGMSAVMGGPALLGTSELQGVAGDLSRITGNIASQRGMGLQAAGRMIAPWAGAAQGGLRNMMSGGGDPYSTALLWQTNRESVGNDPYQMMRRLRDVSADPMGEGLEVMMPAIQQLLRQGGSEYGQAASIQRFFSGLGQDISFEGVDTLIQNRDQIISGDMSQEEMREAIFGVQEETVNEGEETRETMEAIAERGERIMNEQLGELRTNAGYSWQQLGVSASMAADARRAADVQAQETRAMADLLRVSAIGDALRTSYDIREGALGDLAGGDVAAYMRRMGTGLFGMIRHMGASELGGTSNASGTPRGEAVAGVSNAELQQMRANRGSALAAVARTRRGAVVEATGAGRGRQRGVGAASGRGVRPWQTEGFVQGLRDAQEQTEHEIRSGTHHSNRPLDPGEVGGGAEPLPGSRSATRGFRDFGGESRTN